MEKINKIICTDKCRSHVCGLLPFVRYNGTSEIEYVTKDTVGGNYGHYACDPCLINANGKELSRLRTLDILKDFYYTKHSIKNGVFVKKATITEEEVLKITCTNTGNTVSSVTTTQIVFKPQDQVEKYEILDLKYFNKGQHNYSFVVPNEYIEAVEKTPDTRSEEEEKLIDIIDFHKEVIDSGTDFLLILNYNKVAEYNVKWEKWLRGKEKLILDGEYNTPSNILKFYTDVKKYILGETDSDDIVYITSEIKDLGDVIIDEEKAFFTYLPPTMDLQIILNNESNCNYNYCTYEYSVYDGFLKDAVKKYTPTENLRPQWLEYDENQRGGYCESKLPTLIHPSSIMVGDNILGIYKTFGDNYEGGQLFKCVYCTGTSVQTNTYEHKQEVYYLHNTSEEAFLEDGPIQISIGEEELPTPNGDPYQIIGVSVITSSTTKSTVITPIEYDDKDGEKVTLRSITQTDIILRTYGWWECEKITAISNGAWSYNGHEIICGDGEDLRPYNSSNSTAGKKTHKYRNVTILECASKLINKTNVNTGDIFFFLSRYDNGKVRGSKKLENINSDGGEIHSLGIPYKAGEKLNNVSYEDGTEVYDKILITSASGDTMDIIYGLGISVDENGNESIGIKCKDSFHYEKEVLKNISIDGVYNVGVYCDILSNNLGVVGVSSKEYKGLRKVQQSKIMGMTVGSIWTSNNAVEALLFTREGFEELKEDPKYNINLSFNRGNAAAWESHYKLSECNTMEDLENYGNNFFNL